jgi:hypothetical protein
MAPPLHEGKGFLIEALTLDGMVSFWHSSVKARGRACEGTIAGLLVFLRCWRRREYLLGELLDW